MITPLNINNITTPLIENFDSDDSQHNNFNKLYNKINILQTDNNKKSLNILKYIKNELKSKLFLKKVSVDADFIYYIYKIKKNRAEENHSDLETSAYARETDVNNNMYPELKFLYNKEIVLAAIKQTTKIFGNNENDIFVIKNYKKVLVFFKHQSTICAPKAKRIGQCCAYWHLACLVWNIV